MEHVATLALSMLATPSTMLPMRQRGLPKSAKAAPRSSISCSRLEDPPTGYMLLICCIDASYAAKLGSTAGSDAVEPLSSRRRGRIPTTVGAIVLHSMRASLTILAAVPTRPPNAHRRGGGGTRPCTE